MFCLEALLFITVLSVVNATSTIHIYDDAVKENSQEVHGCDNQACDQRCRRLKFPGAACVNGHCVCDNFKHPDEGSLMWESPMETQKTITKTIPGYSDTHIAGLL